jgi:hypothetical protein
MQTNLAGQSQKSQLTDPFYYYLTACVQNFL